MSSISSKSSSKLQSNKSSASGKSSTSGQSGTTTAPRLQSSTTTTTGGRVPRSSSAATTSTSTPSASTNGTSRPGTAKSSTSGVRRVNGNDVTSAGSEVVDAGRSRNGSQNRQVITAEIHETAVSRTGRPLQSSTSGMEGRSSAVGCRQGMSGTSSTAMTADGGVAGSTRQRFQSLTAATVQVQSHIDNTCSSVVDAMSQTPRTEEELEKMRILARHVKIYTDWANHYLEKVDSKCFITDLQSDISTGVVLSDLVFAVVSEPVPNINRAPQNTSQMISNIEKCLTFLVERGASVDGIEAKNIRAGSLKSILGLLFNLSNYKHHLYQQSVQQQHQQQKQSRPTKLSSSGACVPTVLAVQSQTHPSGSPVLEHSRRQLPPLPVVSSGSVDRVPRGSSDGCHQGAAAAVSRDSSPLKPSPRTPPSEERVKNQNEASSLPERDQPKQKNFTECGANTNQHVSPLSPCAIDSKKKQTVKSSSAVAGGKKTSPVIDSGGDVNTTASKSSSMLTKFRLFKDRSTDGKTRGKDESLVRVPPVVPEPDTVDRSRVTSPSGSQQRRQQLPQPTPRSSSRRDQAPAGYDVSQPGSPAAVDGRQTIVANGSSVPGYCSPQLTTSGHHGQYSQVPVVAAHQYYSTQPGQPYYGQGIQGYQQQQQQQQHYQPATGQMVSSPQSPQRMLNYSGLPSSVAHSQQSRLPSSHHNGHVTSPQGAPDHATFVQGRGVTSLHTDAHQHVAQSPGNGPQLYHSQQHQQPQLPRQSGPPSSAPSSRRNNEHPQSQADRRRHGDESAPIKTSSSMPSRTASSTSISSIASTSTACGGGGGSAAGTSSGTARKSGLARRVSSASSGQQQSDSTASNTSSNKRSAKSAVGATSGSSSSSSSRIRSGKTSSTSSSAATSGNVTTRPPHVASSDSNGVGTYGRQNNKSKNIKDEELRPNSDPVEDLKSPNVGPSSLKSPGSRIGLPVGRSDSSRSSSASRALPSGVGSLSRNMNRSTESSTLEGPSTAARSTSAGGGGSPGDQSSESPQSKYVADEGGSGATSRGPAQSTSRLPSKLSQPNSAKSSRSAVEQLRKDDHMQQQNGASGLPQVRSLTSPPAECLLMKPLRDKSSGSVSSGFGDESNHSTSDSTDSVIYQPPCSPGHLPSSPRSTSSTNGGNERHQLTAGIENSSSSAVERDAPEQTSENNGGSLKSPSTSSGSVHSTAAAVIDHIASLRTGSRPTGAASRPPSTTPTTAESAVTNSSRQTNSSATSSTTGCSRESPSTKQDQTDNAFDVQPMQPIVRSSVAMGVVPPSCTVYQPPTARRLPTLLAAQSTSGSSAIPSGPSASRRLTFGRPLIGPSSRYPMNAASSSRIASGTISSSSTSASASGYTSDGDVLHRSSIGGPSSWRRDVNGYGKMHPDQNGGCVPGYGNGYQDRSSGYMSEGGGASVTYARRMQQRFLEGILAVRQSMERSAHFTDDDSFDECSSLSSDELAPPGDDDLLDESQVDAILENASSSDGSNGNSSPPNNGVDSSAVHQTCPRSAAAAAASASRSASNGLVPPLSAASAMRPPIPQQQQNHAPAGNNGSVRTSGGEVDRILGNGWRKYYIDSPSGMPPSNANDRRSGSGLVGPFERGSGQRVTLPLAGGGATVAPGALLVKRSQQSVVTDLRSSSSSARCRDDGEPSAADGTETSRRRSGGGHDNNGVDSSTSAHLGHQRQSGMMASRPNSSSDEQRGERISNYSRGAALMHRHGNEMMTHPDMMNDGDWNQTVGDVDGGAGEQFCDDLRSAHPSRSCSVDGGGARRSSFASASVGAGSVVHKDGGQGPAPQPFYTSGSSIAGYHDYVNINYVGTSRSLGRNGNNRINHNGMNIQQWARNGGSTGMGQRFPGGRMAMSETESIENIAAAAAAAAGWPPSGRSIAGGGAQRNGRELVQRSDSCRSSSNDNEKQSTSGSLPRCGSAVQVWRTDPSNAMAAALRLQAGYGYCGGGTPGRTSASSGYSTPLMSGGKSRLSASSKDDNLHCSTLSLGSNSSAYSTAEEQQAQEIRRLRHELETAQSKISTLSTQLCTNAHVVSAFEQSLANMTHRLQHLAANTDQKEAELSDLRRIIDMLRQQGNIQFNLTSHGPTLNTSTPNKDSSGGSNNCSNSAGNEAQQIRRHVSSDSVVSMCSAGSQQSAATDTSAEKKKKQKTWLKIPFGKAFSRNKKTKTTGSTSDADSDTTSLYSDISVAQSAHAQLLGGGVSLSVPSTPIKLSRSDAVCLSGLSPVPDQSVHDLQQQLHEKDMKLTDIRLEALSSAHQLEQLRDTMNRMKNEMMSLKLDNDRLQQLIEQKGISTDSVLNSHRHSGPPQPHHPNTENRLSLDDPTNLDLLLADSGSRDSQRITLSIRLSPTSSDSKLIETSPIHLIEVLVGIISITSQTTWNQLADIVRKGFQDYLVHLDPGTSLGLSGSSIGCLSIGDVTYSPEVSVPELLPCGYLVGDSTNISVSLKGAAEQSVDSLAFETLIPKTIVQRYVSLLVEHRRIILCGPSGTGKTFLAQRLAEYLVLRAGESLGPKAISTFSVDHKSGRELRQYLSSVADQCEQRSPELPIVIILDSLHHVTSLSEVFNGFLSVDYQSSPYIIGTMNQTSSTCSPTNLQLHHNFRWVLCANHVEPVLGFLARYLRRRVVDATVQRNQSNRRHGDDDTSDRMERVVDWIPRVWQHLNKFLETHSSTEVTFGPRLFLSCPMDVDAVQGWFNDLWNYSIVPYLLEAIKEGVQSYGSRGPWEDPSDWVIKTYPWANPSTSGDSTDWPPLLRLRPEDVGHDSNQTVSTTSSAKVTPPAAPNDSDTNDPLLNMLMRLQEAASYTNSPGSSSGNEAGIDSSEISSLSGIQ